MSFQHREPDASKDATRSRGGISNEEIAERKDFENENANDFEIQSALDAEKKYQPFAFDDTYRTPILLTPDQHNHGLMLIGGSGSGKTTAMENLALRNILDGDTTIFMDVHGDAARRLVDAVPLNRQESLCYIDLSQRDCGGVSFNPLSGFDLKDIPLQVINYLEGLEDIWHKAWSDRAETFTGAALALAMEKRVYTLAHVRRLFTNDQFRKKATAEIKLPDTRDFWLNEYPSYPGTYRREAAGVVLSRLKRLIASPNASTFLCQHTSNFNPAMALKPGAITIINLAKGRIGKKPAGLIGSFLLSALKAALFAREAIPLHERGRVYLYCDEWQNYGTHTFVDMPTELRKYGLCLTLANQFAKQVDPDVLEALLENIENVMVFRVGVDTAEKVQKQFTNNNTTLPVSDFTDRPRHRARLKTGTSHRLVYTAPPFAAYGYYERATAASRRRFSRRIG